MLEIGIDALRPVIRIKRFITFRSEHMRTGMLLVDHDDRSRLHAFRDNGKKTVQVLKPAQRADGNDHHIKHFPVQVVDVIDIHGLEQTGQIQFPGFLIGEGHLVFRNIKTDPFLCLPAFNQGEQFPSVIAAELADHSSLCTDLLQNAPGFLIEERILLVPDTLRNISSPGIRPIIESLFPGSFVSFDILLHEFSFRPS